MNEETWLNRTRQALEAAHGRPISDAEVQAVWTLLQQIAGLTASHQLENERRTELLRRFPEGCRFTLSGYSCAICGLPAIPDEAWLDAFGVRCATCQVAVERGDIPPWLGARREAWYSGPELEVLFRLTTREIRQLGNQKVLRSRTIRTLDGKPHLQAFLVQEHKGILPPKALLQPKVVHQTTTEGPCLALQPWYEATDPRLTLAGFRIKRYLSWL